MGFFQRPVTKKGEVAMALTLEEATKPTQNGNNGTTHSQTSTDLPPPPYLGRSVRIVGPHVNVDMNQSPHPKNARGELGKPLFNWYRNTVSKDPLTRVSAPNHFADRRQFLTTVINRDTKGKVNAKRVAVDDPAAMTRYIKELGYTALRGVVTPQAAGVAGGIGELGRNGLVINKTYGARIHMPDPILTDLPLVADQPVDIGVEDFCKICRKCANTCPTNSIPFGDKVVFNGIEKYKINWLTCYKLRPYVHDHWGSCLTCAAVCPFTKPNAWWHNLAVWSLHTCPIPARPALVRALKWIDDRFWGVTRNGRVRWMGYDSGIKPGDQACTVAGCTASHEGKGNSVVGDVGY